MPRLDNVVHYVREKYKDHVIWIVGDSIWVKKVLFRKGFLIVIVTE